MATTAHSYGANCTLQPASNTFTRRASEVSVEAPKLRAHFFYSSAIPIDDPLAPVPLPSYAATAGPSKIPPRPFSVHDSDALEAAWQASNHGNGSEAQLPTNLDDDLPNKVSRALSDIGSPTTDRAGIENLAKIIRKAHERRSLKLKDEWHVDGTKKKNKKSRQSSDVCGDKHYEVGDPHLALCDNPDHIPFDYAMPVGTDEIGNEEFESGTSKKRHRSPFHRHDRAEGSKGHDVAMPNKPSRSLGKKSSESGFGGSPSERDTTGTPFLRVPDRLKRTLSRGSRREGATSQTDGADSLHEEEGAENPTSEDPDQNGGSVHYRHLDSTNATGKDESPAIQRKEDSSVLVPVGISRLHMVEVPALTVNPIQGRLLFILLILCRWGRSTGSQSTTFHLWCEVLGSTKTRCYLSNPM